MLLQVYQKIIAMIIGFIDFSHFYYDHLILLTIKQKMTINYSTTSTSNHVRNPLFLSQTRLIYFFCNTDFIISILEISNL